jgi:hypothetical protein
VSLGSKKQQLVASSTVESVYMAFHAVGKEAKWLRLLMVELGKETTLQLSYVIMLGALLM